ncbi:TetR/AcrR family transcriptional regulator [Nannocystis radixulma]|uniref:TetR family transcriptional regulator n=1 Tax=Nannocystis radixulma TaxID=2995305 RepID=A0ABT5BHU1_9BACT|nr:TetR/AcrR family transcriptional regulator [Nannocystis radixulma]MDC0673727.1 TetR family transcriptional regulator [Nannocystis radixulma]
MQQPIKLGRPTEADTRHIAQVALRLFEQKGFEAVTMEDVARAASVSRRTLFRHFPSKADLVWTGTDELLGTLKSLAAPYAGRKLAVRSIVSELFVPVLAALDDPDTAEFARRRLKLIAGAPTLLTHPMLQETGALLTPLIDADALPNCASPPLVAHTLVAAAFAAMQWWAEHGEGQSARETMLGALQGIAIAVDRGPTAGS